MTTNIGDDVAAAAAAAAEVAAADERKRLYERYRDDLSKREISNAENHDKSILTYSAAGLGLSISLLKDFIPITKAEYSWTLYWSWIFFCFAIISVILSYPLSQRVIRLQDKRAKRYYLENIETAYDERIRLENFSNFLNQWVSPPLFIFAIISTIFFVSINLKGANMANKKVPTSIAQDGVTGMQMQKVTPPTPTVQKGITGGPMQPVSPSQPAAPSSQQSQSQPQQGGSSSKTKP
ncbi:hypothetical protein QZM89_05695 [Burkholderia gladioli]|uniref:hypothetical protein n=1 Tax=Burkholderia gladioli TaxID=28095 RepID=UPI001FC808E5|nr:hypothetical protein [Burkholderia gladioli]MDN7494669.1 hypothetical protein [Burkholderia gladioli]